MRIPLSSLSFAAFVLLLLLAGCEDKKKLAEAEAQRKATSDLFERSKKEAQKVNQALETDNEGAALNAANACIKGISRVLAADSNYRNASAYPLGVSYYAKKDYHNALKWLRQAGVRDSFNYMVQRYLGLTLMAAGDMGAGKEHIAMSIGSNGSEGNRDFIVRNMFNLGSTAFEFGGEYEERGSPRTGADYKQYGIITLEMAYNLGGWDEARILRQLVAFTENTGDKEKAKNYRQLLKNTKP